MLKSIIGLAAIASLLTVDAVAAVPQADPKWGDGGVSAFYTPTGRLGAKPGKLLKAEPLPEKLVLPQAGGGQRILYTSTDGVAGKGIVAVSGAYFTPKGAPPAGGWPLIAWAHGTRSAWPTSARPPGPGAASATCAI